MLAALSATLSFYMNRWKPKEKELFWYISRTLKICSARYLNNKNPKNNNVHKEIATSLNCYKTQAIANKALHKIRRTLIYFHKSLGEPK